MTLAPTTRDCPGIDVRRGYTEPLPSDPAGDPVFPARRPSAR